MSEFDLKEFLPYLLNQAAEASSREFQAQYKARYGMLRTEWRVLFHLGRHGEMTAREICEQASIHKTKVSRAVAALQAKRFLARRTDARDRRSERLALTRAGDAAFRDLTGAAAAYDRALSAAFTETEDRILRACLHRIAEG